jgi:cytoskeleton protein RodZ
MSDAQDDVPLNESGEPSQIAPAAVTAGGLLRQARLAKGLHIAALATSIKVAPRKLELLEADRFDELPGATFTRALAQTVCRTLKIDAAPVLALLPQPVDQGLSHMSLGLNAPFRDKPGRHTPSDLQFLRSPVVMGAAVLVLASVLVFLLPAGWVAQVTQMTQGAGTEPGTSTTVVPPPVVEPPIPVAQAIDATASPATGTAPAAQAASDAGPPVAASEPGASAPAPASAGAGAATAPSGALLLSASAQSWIEVVDGRGQTLLSRNLDAGETVGLDGPSPLRVKIGNASATRVSFKGRPVELAPSRDNVAKLELR